MAGYGHRRNCLWSPIGGLSVTDSPQGGSPTRGQKPTPFHPPPVSAGLISRAECSPTSPLSRCAIRASPTPPQDPSRGSTKSRGPRRCVKKGSRRARTFAGLRPMRRSLATPGCFGGPFVWAPSSHSELPDPARRRRLHLRSHLGLALDVRTQIISLRVHPRAVARAPLGPERGPGCGFGPQMATERRGCEPCMLRISPQTAREQNARVHSMLAT